MLDRPSGILSSGAFRRGSRVKCFRTAIRGLTAELYAEFGLAERMRGVLRRPDLSKDTALALLDETGYRVLDFFCTPQYERAPKDPSHQTMALIRRFATQFAPDATTKLFGGCPLLVLAEKGSSKPPPEARFRHSAALELRRGPMQLRVKFMENSGHLRIVRSRP